MALGRRLVPLLLSLAFLVACAGPAKEAERQAEAGGFARTLLRTDPFVLTAFVRQQDGAAPLVVYMEGDGRAWLNRSTPSTDPTPHQPVALRLALRDRGPNVAYLARPCQYTPMPMDAACTTPRYWTSHRFAEEVVASASQAIDRLKASGRSTGVHLVGFSGGAAVAALVAARREDVLSLTTVAGNLDHDALNRLHGVSPMPASLNPADQTHRLAALPQRHWVGGRDEVVPLAIAQSFLSRMAASPCAQVRVVDDLDHLGAWEEHWPPSEWPRC